MTHLPDSDAFGFVIRYTRLSVSPHNKLSLSSVCFCQTQAAKVASAGASAAAVGSGASAVAAVVPGQREGKQAVPQELPVLAWQDESSGSGCCRSPPAGIPPPAAAPGPAPPAAAHGPAEAAPSAGGKRAATATLSGMEKREKRRAKPQQTEEQVATAKAKLVAQQAKFVGFFAPRG